MSGWFYSATIRAEVEFTRSSITWMTQAGPILSSLISLLKAASRGGVPSPARHGRTGERLRRGACALRQSAGCRLPARGSWLRRDWFRETLKDKRIRACVPGRKQRKAPVKYDKRRYKRRNWIEIMFGQRVATRYDRFPKVFLSVIALAATAIYWLGSPEP